MEGECEPGGSLSDWPRSEGERFRKRIRKIEPGETRPARTRSRLDVFS